MKHFKITLIISLVFISFLLWNCYYDNEEQLYPEIPDNNCDTVNISYSGHIAKTIAFYCNSCHGDTYKDNGNGIQLNNYNGVVKNIDKIIGAITHNPDYIAMPKDASKMSDCKINQFIIWKNEGSLNN